MPTEARGNYLPEPPYLRETKTYHSQPVESIRHAGNHFVPIYIYTAHFYFLLQNLCQITWLLTGWKKILYFWRLSEAYAHPPLAWLTPLLGPRSRKPFPQIKIYHYTPGASPCWLLPHGWSSHQWGRNTSARSSANSTGCVFRIEFDSRGVFWRFDAFTARCRRSSSPPLGQHTCTQCRWS